MEAETTDYVVPVMPTQDVEETIGQRFKKKHGYSRTMAELLRKHKMTLEQYKLHRRARKKAVRKVQKDNHTKAVAQRGSAAPKVHKKR
jgi:hypothetical protein